MLSLTKRQSTAMGRNGGKKQRPQWTMSTAREHNKLACSESDWKLAGGTLNEGRGRTRSSNFRMANDKDNSSDDSNYSLSSSSGDDEVSIDMEELTIEAMTLEDKPIKPEARNVVLEVDVLKDLVLRSCHCQKCYGRVEFSMKTICIASSIILTCKDKSCGYIYNSPLPAVANLGRGEVERERSTAGLRHQHTVRSRISF
jgi:hypothetical protein